MASQYYKEPFQYYLNTTLNILDFNTTQYYQYYQSSILPRWSILLNITNTTNTTRGNLQMDYLKVTTAKRYIDVDELFL
jgi:hypothetical protein